MLYFKTIAKTYHFVVKKCLKNLLPTYCSIASRGKS